MEQAPKQPRITRETLRKLHFAYFIVLALFLLGYIIVAALHG